MQYFPAALQNLADQFARLPGIGGKTAQRLAFYVLGLPEEDAQEFADYVEETYPDCDVEFNYGGQPIYYYILSVE